MIAVPDSRGALDSVRVLDLATYLAAPVCATLLGEFGAEVIKVEQPRVGDDLRRLGRAAGPDAGGSYWWFVESRNKKSITCNLRDPEGQTLIRRLVAESHVLTENFRPGTLERWNLGWEALSAIRHSLVMVRISAFGQTGPSRERPGFGRIAAAVGGLAYLSGYPDRPPVSPGTRRCPITSPASSARSALSSRSATPSAPARVRSSIWPSTSRSCACSTTPSRWTAAPGTCASGSARAPARDGRWIAIACTNDRMFARLLRAMGRTDLADDPRMTTTPARLAHRGLVDELVAGWIAARDASETLAALEAAEVPSSLVASVRDLFEDAHVKARENIVSVALPLLGRLAMPGVVPRLTLTPGRIDSAGPSSPGAHNEEIYGGRLGLSREALARLAERGVI